MTTKQMKTFKVIHFSMKVFILQHNCVKRTTTKCPKGDGKSDIGSYFLITEISEAEEWINELEGRMVEITPEEQNKGKRLKRIEDSLRDFWYNIK